MLASIAENTCWAMNNVKEVVRELIHNPQLIKEKRQTIQKAKHWFSLHETTKDF